MSNQTQISMNAGPSNQAAGQAGAVNPLLARLLQLASKVLNADSPEKKANLIVNEIHTIVKTDRAVLASVRGRKRIVCISGDLEPSQDNIFAQGVNEIRRFVGGDSEPRILDRENLPPEAKAPKAREIFEAMGGTRILWLPLPSGANREIRYALWLERWGDRPWMQEEIRLVSHAALFFGHALASSGAHRRKKTPKAIKLVAALAMFAAVMWIPMQSRISSPVQVVPDRPHYIFAPFDGIVEDLAVLPGQNIDKGGLIFKYDTRVLEKQLDEAERGGVAVALAELARLEGAAYDDEEARAKIPVQKLEVQLKKAEVKFLKKQLDLAEVKTDSDGVVVLDDPDALIGAALQTGQMVLSVADPAKTKLRMMVPVTDAGLLNENAEAVVRLDSDPMSAIPARIERIGFDVRISDERIPSIFVEAVWENKENVNPGERGMAVIKGPRVYLWMQLFRKPLITLRTMIGI